MDGLEFINFTNYTVKKTDVFLGKDQALITGLTFSSKNSVNMFMSLKVLLFFCGHSILLGLNYTVYKYKPNTRTQSIYKSIYMP